MSRGKYLSLEEARKKKGGLDRFSKEHPSEGDERQFDRTLWAMAGRKPKAIARTSNAARGEDYAETQTPKDTSEDA
jgi:hypothetical protein